MLLVTTSKCILLNSFSVLLYLLVWGGRMPVLNWCLFVLGMSVAHISSAARLWFLGYWAEKYQEASAVNVG